MDKQELLIKLTEYINEKNTETISKNDISIYINSIYKEKRKPTLYNLFIKEQMEIINKEEPNKKDKMKYIIKLWNDRKPIIKGNLPRKLL